MNKIRLTTILALLLLVGGTASADELAIRVLPDILVSDAARTSVPPDQLVPLTADIQVNLQRGIAGAYPKAWAAGEAREASNRMETELEDLLYFAFRLSRHQQRRFQYGDEKTVFSLYLTGSLTLLDLGSGEMMGSRTFTVVLRKEVMGTPADLDPATKLSNSMKASDALVDALVDQFSQQFRPGVIEATVAGQHRSDIVLARGYLDGAYRGEVFKDGKGGMVRLTSIQEKLSVGEFLGPAGTKPTAGAVLSRVGTPGPAGDAPRLAVFVADPGAEVAPGVSGAELAQWVGDNLVESGFTVIPSSTELFLLQADEASKINVSADKLMGSMASPDILVAPTVLRHVMYVQQDEETESEINVLEVVVSASFIDVATGTVLYGTSVEKTTHEVTQEGGRQTDPVLAFTGLVKDSSSELAQIVGDEFQPRRAYGRLRGPTGPSGNVAWVPDGVPLGLGTVAEVLAASREFVDPEDGTSIGFVEEPIGTVKVTGSRPKAEEGQVLVASVPLAAGQRLRAVVGTAATDLRIVELGKLDVQVNGSDIAMDEPVRDCALAALYTGGHFRAVLDSEDRAILEAASYELTGGSYADLSLDTLQSGVATHRLDITTRLVAEAPAVQGKLRRRAFRVEATGSLVNLRTGEPEVLLSPSKGAVMVYDMWMERELRARERRNRAIVGMRDEDVPAHLSALSFVTLDELMRRVRLLADKGLER